MLFVFQDILSDLHGFAVRAFTVDAEDSVLLQNPLANLSLDIKNIPGGHEVERHIGQIGNFVHRIRIGMRGVIRSDQYSLICFHSLLNDFDILDFYVYKLTGLLSFLPAHPFH